MNIEHISISRSKLYKECSYKYKHKYHLKTVIPGPEQFYFTYGKIIHKIAQVYVEEKGKRSLSEIQADVLRGKILLEANTKAPPIPKEYKSRMPNHIKSIRRITNLFGFEGEVEYPIYVDLDPPNKKYIKGFIDRIIFKGDSAFVLDYKTTKPGSWREDKNSIKYDPQLRYYARFVSQKFNIKPEKITAALLYLDDYQVVSATYSEESLIQIEKDLLNVYNEIHARDPDTTWGNVTHNCVRCEFASICPFYKSKSQTNVWDGDMSSLGH